MWARIFAMDMALQDMRAAVTVFEHEYNALIREVLQENNVAMPFEDDIEDQVEGPYSQSPPPLEPASPIIVPILPILSSSLVMRDHRELDEDEEKDEDEDECDSDDSTITLIYPRISDEDVDDDEVREINEEEFDGPMAPRNLDPEFVSVESDPDSEPDTDPLNDLYTHPDFHPPRCITLEEECFIGSDEPENYDTD